MGDVSTMSLTSGLLMTSRSIDASASPSETVDFRVAGDPLVTCGASLLATLIDDEGTNSTQGSLFGFPVSFIDGSDPEGSVDVTYSGAVTLAGAAAAGYLFTIMTIDFSGLIAGGFLGFTQFQTDMDTLAVARDLCEPEITPPSAIPPPAGLPLLLSGLAGLGMLRRRKLQN